MIFSFYLKFLALMSTLKHTSQYYISGMIYKLRGRKKEKGEEKIALSISLFLEFIQKTLKLNYFRMTVHNIYCAIISILCYFIFILQN